MSETTSIFQKLRDVESKISEAYESRYDQSDVPSSHPKLVAVSKTKSVNMIKQAYDSGQRRFGENYVQELSQKSTDPIILKYCPEIKWHFIGHCQSSNVTKILRCKNLTLFETISSQKLADKLQNLCQSQNHNLNVMVQVNTSNEDTKHGVHEESVIEVVKHITESCSNLKFMGLMTIGSTTANHETKSNENPNPDFLKLKNIRSKLANELNIDISKIGLSMGMSNDFQHAIRMGATSVRVGSIIFGARS